MEVLKDLIPSNPYILGAIVIAAALTVILLGLMAMAKLSDHFDPPSNDVYKQEDAQ